MSANSCLIAYHIIFDLSSTFFKFYNNFGIRPSNDKQVTNSMSEAEIEKWYDDIYTSTLFVVLAKEKSRILKDLSKI